MAGSWGTKYAILADDELLNTVRGTDLGNELGDLWIPVATISTDDKSRALYALGDGEQDAGNEGLGVVVLLKDLDLLTETRTGEEIQLWSIETVDLSQWH